jgi:hypothetical protein
MAFVLDCAGDRVCPDTLAQLARIRLRTSVAVTAHRAIGRIGFRALTRDWIARSGRMALIDWHTLHRVCPNARSCLASIDLSAQIVIIADGSVHHDGIAARSRGRIARARQMALIQRRADDRVCPETHAGLT